MFESFSAFTSGIFEGHCVDVFLQPEMTRARTETDVCLGRDPPQTALFPQAAEDALVSP